MEKCEEAVDKAADGREEIPFEEASAAVDTVPKPELETPPRRTRKERQAAASAAVCEADTYFYIEADDNYVMKHKGDTIPEGAKEISKEEFRVVQDIANQSKEALIQVTESKATYEKQYAKFRKLLSASSKDIPLSEIMDCIDNTPHRAVPP